MARVEAWASFFDEELFEDTLSPFLNKWPNHADPDTDDVPHLLARAIDPVIHLETSGAA